MRTAYNPQTREVLGLKNGQWTKLQTASNDKGDMLYLGDSGWEPLNLGSASTPDQPQQPTPQAQLKGETPFDSWFDLYRNESPETPDTEQGGNRGLSLGMRNVLEGIGSVAGTIANPFANTINWMLGGDPNYFKNPGAAASDIVGLATPQTDDEKLRSRIIEGTSGAVVPIVGGAAAASRAVSPVARSVGRMVAEAPVSQILGGGIGNAAAETARQSGAGEGTQLALGLLGASVAPGAVAAAGSARNRMGNLINPEKLQAFRNLGYEAPSLGAVSDSGVVQNLESGLSQALPTAGVMKRARERGQQILDSAVDQTADDIAGGGYVPQNREQLGMFTREATEGSRKAFTEKASRLEDEVYSPFTRNKTKLPTTFERIEQLTDTGSPTADFEARDRLYRQLGGIGTDARDFGGTTVAAARQYRRALGERMGAQPTANTSDATRGEMKNLYGAVSEDIRNAIPENQRESVDAYTRWYANQKQLREDIDKSFFKSGNDSATANALLTADAGKLIELERILGPESIRSIRAGILREAVKNSAGDFTPASIIKGATGGNKLQEVRSRMTPQTRNLIKAAKALQESRAFANTSNTAGALSTIQNLGWGIGALANLPAAAASAGSIYGLGRLLTSPGALRRLNAWRISPTNAWGALVPAAGTQVTQQPPLSLLDLISQMQE